jgi:hypothetical protein
VHRVERGGGSPLPNQMTVGIASRPPVLVIADADALVRGLAAPWSER